MEDYDGKLMIHQQRGARSERGARSNITEKGAAEGAVGRVDVNMQDSLKDQERENRFRETRGQRGGGRGARTKKTGTRTTGTREIQSGGHILERIEGCRSVHTEGFDSLVWQLPIEIWMYGIVSRSRN